MCYELRCESKESVISYEFNKTGISASEKYLTMNFVGMGKYTLINGLAIARIDFGVKRETIDDAID